MNTVRTMPKTHSRSSKVVVQRAVTSTPRARTPIIDLGYSAPQVNRIKAILADIA